MIWNFKEPQEFKRSINGALHLWHLGKEEILSRSRQEPLVSARAILMVSIRKRSNLSLQAIGRSFNRDHATVMHHCDSHPGRMQTDAEYKENFLALEDFLDNVE